MMLINTKEGKEMNSLQKIIKTHKRLLDNKSNSKTLENIINDLIQNEWFEHEWFDYGSSRCYYNEVNKKHYISYIDGVETSKLEDVDEFTYICYYEEFDGDNIIKEADKDNKLKSLGFEDFVELLFKQKNLTSDLMNYLYFNVVIKTYFSHYDLKEEFKELILENKKTSKLVLESIINEAENMEENMEDTWEKMRLNNLYISLSKHRNISTRLLDLIVDKVSSSSKDVLLKVASNEKTSYKTLKKILLKTNYNKDICYLLLKKKGTTKNILNLINKNSNDEDRKTFICLLLKNEENSYINYEIYESEQQKLKRERAEKIKAAKLEREKLEVENFETPLKKEQSFFKKLFQRV